MAEPTNKDEKKVRRVKKVETVRQRASKASEEPGKRRLHKTATTAARPLKAAATLGRKEYYLPLPKNKAGSFLNKKRRATPGFLINAWREVRSVTWPGRRETIRLTFAVATFAFVFGTVIAIVDYGLDKLFRALLLS